MTLRDVDLIGLGRRIEVDAAVGRAAVVLHLEGEAGVAAAIGVGRRRELQAGPCDVAGTDELADASPAVPLLVSVPAAGSVVIFTAKQRCWPALSFGSLKPKSAGLNV